jgi:hypothetical protein
VNLSRILEFLRIGFLNIIGIPIGNYSEAFTGVSLKNMEFSGKAIMWLPIVILSGFLFCFVRDILKKRMNVNIYILAYLFFMFFLILLSASITTTQEARWLYPAYLIFLIFFAYLLTNINIRPIVVNFLLVVLLVCMVTIEINNRNSWENSILFRRQALADSLYDQTVGEFGNGIKNYSLYIKEIEGGSTYWWLGYGTFFKPYFEDSKNDIKVFQNISEINLQRVKLNNLLILDRAPDKDRFIDITENFSYVLK